MKNVIIELWKRQPGKYFCISTKSPAGKWKDHFFSPDDFGSIKQFLRDYDDHDIYFCPHGFNRRVRQKEEAVIPNLLWADLDYSDPRNEKVFKGLKPTIAIESSPGRYVGLWELDKPMTEDINRRLTYHLEADHGGWDLTQVLRFPGTKNYKYKSQPRVRVMWDDGKVYKRKNIESKLPEEDEEEEGQILSAAEVFSEYEAKLPRWVRRELLAKKITGTADRSEMLWKLENACLEAGMTTDEALAVIKRSAWNKFAGRRNEDAQLRREIEKVVNNQFRDKGKGKEKLKRKSDEEEREEEYESRFNFIPMAKVQRVNLDFLWEPYLARGEVSILEGDPGLGKSYLAMMVSAMISTGQRIPTFKRGLPVSQGSVVYFDLENSAGSVTKPRLEDNGFTDLNDYYPIEEGFSIDDEDAIAEIYEHLEVIKPSLLVFDTLNTYIGRADAHKAAEVTQAMGVFKKLAKDFNCAVLVLRHLTKGTGSAMYRGQGSIAFSGSARVVMSVGVDPNDTETRVMCVTKINFAKAPPGLAFRIDEKPKGKSAFVWGGFVNYSAQEVLDAASNARAEGKQGTHMQDAMEFLEATITGAAIEMSKLFRMAEKRSINVQMLERAATKMGVIRKTHKGVETWKIKPSEPGDDGEE